MTQEYIDSPEGPVFETHIHREIKNYLTGDNYKFLGGGEISFSDKDIKRIVEICSQEDCYNFIFKNRLQGESYGSKDAISYVNWVKEGWESRDHFAFIVRNDKGDFVGTLDIKSPNLNQAEVGCWSDERCSGFMTNAMKELIEISRTAGYKSLFARVKSENSKSYNMLLRAGFNKTEERERKDGEIEFVMSI